MSALAELPKPQVGLFATCLVDLFRPSVGSASAKLIEESGCDVIVPIAQTCCGRPSHSSGDCKDACAMAEQVIEAFESFDYVVAPSGSCAAMLSKLYPLLFRGDPKWEARAKAFAAKSHELVSFLADTMSMPAVKAAHTGVATYHDACSGLQELDIHAQPRALLASVAGLELTEMNNSGACCGLASRGCAGYADAARMRGVDKAAAIDASGADLLLAGDLGCLMHLAGKLKRRSSSVEIRHVAEILAGATDTAPIAGRKR